MELNWVETRTRRLFYENCFSIFPHSISICLGIGDFSLTAYDMIWIQRGYTRRMYVKYYIWLRVIVVVGWAKRTRRGIITSFKFLILNTLEGISSFRNLCFAVCFSFFFSLFWFTPNTPPHLSNFHWIILKNINYFISTSLMNFFFIHLKISTSVGYMKIEFGKLFGHDKSDVFQWIGS